MKEISPNTLFDSIEIEGGGEEIQELVKSFNRDDWAIDEAFAMQRRSASGSSRELERQLQQLRLSWMFKWKKRMNSMNMTSFCRHEDGHYTVIAIFHHWPLEFAETSELERLRTFLFDLVVKIGSWMIWTWLLKIIWSTVRIDAHSSWYTTEAQKSPLKEMPTRRVKILLNAIRYNNGQLTKDREGVPWAKSSFWLFYRCIKSRDPESAMRKCLVFQFRSRLSWGGMELMCPWKQPLRFPKLPLDSIAWCNRL